MNVIVKRDKIFGSVTDHRSVSRCVGARGNFHRAGNVESNVVAHDWAQIRQGMEKSQTDFRIGDGDYDVAVEVDGGILKGGLPPFSRIQLIARLSGFILTSLISSRRFPGKLIIMIPIKIVRMP